MVRARAAAALIASLCSVTAVIFAMGPSAAVDAKAVCAKVASPNGDDSASGTAGSPYATAQRLASSLAAGETGCLRAGTYRQDELTLATPGISLTSYPGERATVAGRLRVTADRVTVERLGLDGRNARDLPSPTINADDVIFRRDDVSSRGSGICFIFGSLEEVRHPVLKRNRIHNCGQPGGIPDHGIYMQDVRSARIVRNTIYDNAERGIKIGPDSQRALIRRNVIDGNPIGLNFSGDESSASSGNVVTGNVISNSTAYWNVQSYWPGPVGSGNVVSRNCVHGGNPDSDYNENGGISDGPGFSAVGNLIASPDFINRGAKDFRLRRDSECRGVYGAGPSGGEARELLAPALELRSLIEEVLAYLQ
ncbi:MAG TPA: right-handed parallel beta-helix repeat-containing protein [Solirubrobacterales bacterium]